MSDSDHPTKLTFDDIDKIFEQLMNSEIKIHKCFKCDKDYIASYGHHLNECDQCYFARFPKEEVHEWMRRTFLD